MKKRCILVLSSFFVISIIGNLFAEDLLSENNKSKLSIGGNGHIMFGQIVSGHTHGKMEANPTEKSWQNFYAGRIDAISEPTDWFKAIVSLEIASAWPVVRESNIMKEIFVTQFKPNLPQAVGIFDFDLDVLSLMIEAGIMEYAFNTEVKNLGNYMFRTKAYPLVINTDLDYIYSNLMGARVEVGFLEDHLKVGTIFNSNINQPPFFDWNLAFYASYKMPNNLIDVGAGVNFDHLIAIDDEITDAKNLKDTTKSDLTFRATKIDARVTFDPKAFFPNVSIFGPNDLKVYAEAAILGLEDPDYFPIDTTISWEDTTFPRPSLLHRIPILIGFNIPTFKGLDVFSIEFEYLNYPYANDWWGGEPSFSPVPSYPNSGREKDRWAEIYKNRDNLKWTLYAKKSISNFDIIALFGSDHIRYSTHSAESQFYTEQSLRAKWDWHWYVKLQYNL